MIYVGIGSLQCSGEKREVFPIMLDAAGNATLVNVNGNTLAWHMRTTRPNNIFWVGPVHPYQDDYTGFAMQKLMELKTNMKNGLFSGEEDEKD